MTNNTKFKTLVNTWLNQKKPMITPSTHASFTLIAENHLIPYFGKRKIGSITEADIQNYISYLYNEGRLDKTGGLTVKTIRDVILVLRLSMEYAYKERAISLLNWELIEYPKELGVKKSRFSFKGSGTSANSVHLHELEPEDSRDSDCAIHGSSDWRIVRLTNERHFADR